MEQTVRVLGVPMDLGADRRGVDMGPSAIRYAGLADQLEGFGQACTDGGDLAVPRPETASPEAAFPDGGRAKFLDETREVCEDVATAVEATVEDGEFPLVLGGDHSIAMGTTSGLSTDRELGVLWFDAHGDFNTPTTTPSGNVHGMTLAGILGKGAFAEEPWAVGPNVREDSVALVGLRDLDDGERDNIADSDVAAYTMSDIDEDGLASVIQEALAVATSNVDALHVSLDLDWLDPSEAPGVGTPVRGGVSYREAHVAMEMVANRAGDMLAGAELVEVNPILDQHNRTAELAVELVGSLFGERIL